MFALTPATLKFCSLTAKPSSLHTLNLEIDEKTAFIPYLPPKVDTGASLKHVFRERGWNKIPEARLSTRFPFGFFKKWIKIDLGDDEVLVFPKIDPIDPGDETFREGPGEAESEKTGFGFDLRSIKEFRQGDNPRLIHWKMTAKTGRLMVREMEDEETRGAVIEFHPKGQNETRAPDKPASLFVELLKRGLRWSHTLIRLELRTGRLRGQC
jgi:uncharacterized protein (DUF58 family)